jgi:hypothetical protein
MITPTTLNMSLTDSNSPPPQEEPLYYGPISPTAPLVFADQQLPDDYSEMEYPMIEPGTYVAFAVAKKFLALQFPEGSEGYQAILNVPIIRYVGLVTSSHAYRTPDGILQEMIIHFATKSSSLCPSVADYCMPISSDSTGSNRPPLQTDTFFPWVDCKQLTTQGVRVAVEDLQESSLNFTLEHEEFDRFEEAALEDNRDFQGKEESLSSEEKAKVRRLEVQYYTIPADIWMDIRLGDVKANPSGFADGVDEVEWFVLAVSTNNIQTTLPKFMTVTSGITPTSLKRRALHRIRITYLTCE